MEPRIAVVMATYNNAGTLATVLAGVRAHAPGTMIVVDDGSTDNSAAILSAEQGIDVVSVTPNRGKGHALRKGFERARALGFTHAITIDTDGQHDPADIPAVAQAIMAKPDAMVMGVRNMDQASVPGRSSFGNRFSNFWFKVETGITLRDTQTGFRGWPLMPLEGKRWLTDRFGFEVEAIVKMAWSGTPFAQVPVRVRYDFPERVSHFKPFLDFSRISVLNTWLVTCALMWYWPKRLLLQGGLWRVIKAEAIHPEESSLRKACAIGFGFFMGIVPIWGLQLLVGIPLAYALRLNRVLFVAAANISLPPMIPLILYASYRMGAPFAGADAYMPDSFDELSLAGIHAHVMQYAVGAVLLALMAGGLGVAISYPILRALRKR
ncbi:MAG TPA: DUF2062 domain-containing protein [Flavobacteriales bacterium]|nr:DUF2062 domain-containing protein [Flavobacteriales bacterium]